MLKPVLDDADRQAEAHRSVSERTHVSTLIRDCGRMVQLAKISPIPIYQSAPTGGHRVMWEIGRAVERHVRAQFVKRVQGVDILGEWTCRCRATRHRSMGWPGHECGVCGDQLRIYDEITLTDHDRNLQGRPDMILLRNGRLVVVEIKSMNEDEWNDLAQPLGDHIGQAGLYRQMLANDGQDVADYTVFLYVVKRFRWGSPYKEFTVHYAPGNTWDNMVQHHLRQAEAINAGVLLPRQPACASPSSPQSRSCPTCTDCYLRN